MTSIIDRPPIDQQGSPSGRFIDLSQTEDQNGVTWRRLEVPDISDGSRTRERTQSYISAANTYLEQNPDAVAPTVNDEKTLLTTRNKVSDWVYDPKSTPAMREWRQVLVPSAMALYPIQRPFDAHLPNGFPIDEASRSFFMDAIDSIGIRSRALIMKDIMDKYVSRDGQATKWVSLASGAAIPVLDALEDIGDPMLKFHLVDFDKDALEFAVKLAAEQGLTEGENFETHVKDLRTEMILGDGVINEIGEQSANAVDALGIFEYFSNRTAEQFMRQAYRLVQPGGCIVIANMLDTHPELAFNTRGIGWPKIYPRSMEQITSIVQAAGIDLSNVTAYTASDGVYGVLEIKRPLESVVT